MNGCDEDTPRADPLREEPTLVKRLCAERPADTTSEPWGRNAPPGAPVRASMSDGSIAVTRVEPWNTSVSHP